MGIELLLATVGLGVIQALGTVGVGLVAPATSVGGTALTAGGAALVGTGGAIGSAANPMIAGGFEAASADAYNNTVTGVSTFVNGLDLAFLPPMNLN